MGGELPDGWKECPSFAETLIDNKFFCFKTPLSSTYGKHLTAEQKLCPTDVIKEVQERYQTRIGLWIDLTNTDKYYSGGEVIENGVRYKKIKCSGGGGGVMRWGDVEQFIEACLRFLNTNTSADNELIAVHCTHGLNRTGFVICAFLVQCRGYSLQDALTEFTKCRPIGIFRQSLVDQLCAAYRSRYEPRIEASPKPSWIKK